MSRTKNLIQEDKSTGLEHQLNHAEYYSDYHSTEFDKQLNRLNVQLVDCYVDRIVQAGTSPNEKWKAEVITECRSKLINLIKKT